MEQPESPLQRVFLDAVAIEDADRRTAFLEQACAGDDRLRNQVEALVQAHRRIEGFLPRRPASRPASPDPDQSDRHRLKGLAIAGELVDRAIGTRVGRYRLLERIGEGGCGVVYRAEQQEPVRRQVALKLVKPGMDTRAVIARFGAERQALAMMDHPNIARVLDAGSTDTGHPFFVMELVVGPRITEFASRHQLPLRRRLELLIEVCRAVQHAHQKGVIHRDLKPSNILVAEEGGQAVPKIIDFGIAKATEGRLTEGTCFSSLYQFVGTPAYMSPEQIVTSGSDVDTRTDIYSLGVLLYELLTGTTPFETRELLALGPDGLRKILTEREPARPSTRLTERRRIAPSGPPSPVGPIASDLDWIAIKCLEKDRNRRYSTANGLASDIQRYLNHEPVVARPPSRLYEFRKTMRRHRVGFATAATVILALLVGIVMSGRETLRARRAERIIRNESYVHGMMLGYEAANSQDFTCVREIADETRSIAAENLDSNHPQPTHSTPRWEWRHLQYEARDDSSGVFAQCPDAMRSLRVSPNGRWIAGGSRNGQILLWSFPDGRQAARWNTTGQVRSLEFSPDSQFLASGRVEGLAQVQSILSGEIIFEWDCHQTLLGFQFSPDGKRLAIGSRLGYAVVDLESRRFLSNTPCQHGAWQFGITRDFQTTAILGENRGLCFNSEQGPVFRPEVISESRHSFGRGISPDDRLFAAPTADHAIELWQLHPARRLHRLEAHTTMVDVLAWSHDGRWLATGGGKQPIGLWNAADGHLHRWLRGHSGAIYAADFGPDNTTLYTVGKDPAVRKWEPFAVDAAVGVLPLPDSTVQTRLSPNGHFFSVMSSNGTIQVFDTRHLDTPPVQRDVFPSSHLGLSPDRNTLWTAARDENGIVAWPIPLEGPPPPPTQFPLRGALSGEIAIAPNGRRLALRFADGGLEVWNRDPWTRLGQWQLPEPHLLHMCFDAAGDHLFVQENLAGLFVVDLPGNHVRQLEDPPRQSIEHFALSADGHTLVTLNSRSAALWELAWPAPPRMVEHFADSNSWPAGAIALSADSKTLAIGAESGEIWIWDIQRRTAVGRLRGQRQSILQLAFREDDETLVSLSSQELRIWPVRKPLQSHPEAPIKVATTASTSARPH